MSATDTSAAAVKQTEHQTNPTANVEAEESVLGALMLINPESGLYDTIADTGLTAGDFYRPSHGLIYRTIVELHDQAEPTDAITVTETLDRKHRLEKIDGGKTRVFEIAALVPPTASAAHWARIVVDNARRRWLHMRLLEAQAVAQQNGAPPDELLDQIRALFDDTATAKQPRLEVLTLEQFTSTTEDITEPLIGTTDDMLLPADGLLLMYGGGGAGKTTLSIDALVHTAAGTPWLTNTIAQPQRCILIENEGPRGPFRRLLQRKRDTWQGRPFHDNVHVLEEPWARFTLDDTACRRGLATEIDRTAADLVMIGPLASLGAKGTGTPDDVNEFAQLIADLRYRTTRPFALWIIHHENKAGDISGAWERLPDTLLHVSAQGNGRTRLGYRKARWSSRLHDTAVTLTWAENASFEVVPDTAERDLHADLLAAFVEDDRTWIKLDEAARLVKAQDTRVREVLGELVETGSMTFQIGPPGRHATAKCWRLEPPDPTAPEVVPLPGTTPDDLPSARSLTSQVVRSSDLLRKDDTDEVTLSDQPGRPPSPAEDDERARWLDAE